MPVICGDCLEVMRRMDENSIDSIVTDPPAGISFMGKKWDHDKGGRDQWIAWMTTVATECLRATKPGSHALVWALPRTSHWTATAWENAGWEIREVVIHIFGSGFPKNLDVSKSLDKAKGVEREVVGFDEQKAKQQTPAIGTSAYGDYQGNDGNITAPATDAAKQWNGWGTALKPAHEDWILMRKPIEGTVAQNILEWECGGINVDMCRVRFISDTDRETSHKNGLGPIERYKTTKRVYDGGKASGGFQDTHNPTGRFPANLIHDGSDEVLALFPQSKGQQGKITGNEPSSKTTNTFGQFEGRMVATPRDDSGSSARFFYCAKPSSSERNAGLPEGTKNKHPTLKSISLMRYLCRLITPPGGIVLDPFCGSGSTGIAAHLEGFKYVLIDNDSESVKTARLRLNYWISEGRKHGTQAK